MLSDQALLTAVLDRELIGFLTAVNRSGQPQTSPVWYLRVGDDLVVYNRPGSPRLSSIAANPRVAFTLRGDLRARGGVSLEGQATMAEDLPTAEELPGYVDKYGREIDRLGWTPASFSADYSLGLRIVVTRVRAFGLEKLSD
ncbi:MAG TPA: pyridoxamine 5'-phosphate oxidase family protein [Acidimicrobiia bacterium]|nr:pyridoxamine 5'-phosphate oxidase family protein [Acidimicrobiia bacterium]